MADSGGAVDPVKTVAFDQVGIALVVQKILSVAEGVQLAGSVVVGPVGVDAADLKVRFAFQLKSFGPVADFCFGDDGIFVIQPQNAAVFFKQVKNTVENAPGTAPCDDEVFAVNGFDQVFFNSKLCSIDPGFGSKAGLAKVDEPGIFADGFFRGDPDLCPVDLGQMEHKFLCSSLFLQRGGGRQNNGNGGKGTHTQTKEERRIKYSFQHGIFLLS